MAIGDIWRCACSGFVGDPDPEVTTVRSTWVNVFHLQTLDGVGTEDEEADAAAESLVATYQNIAFGELWGEGVFLTLIVTDKIGDAFTKEHTMEVPLGTEGFLPLPTQVCVAVTGRSDEVGRRVTLYLAGISEAVLGQWGQFAPNGEEGSLDGLFGTKFGGAFSFDCVMFDRADVLPTLIIDLFKVSANFRTQRRRVLSAENEFTTVYGPVAG